MSVLPVGFGSSGGLQITNSVRLRAAASAYFSRTFGAPTDGKIGVFRAYLKRGLLTTAIGGSIFGDNTPAGPHYTKFGFTNGGDTLKFVEYVSGALSCEYTTTAVFRDPSGHYDISVVMDSTAGVGDRIKIYVNGVRQTTTVGTEKTINNTWRFTSANAHSIGRNENEGAYLDGYLSDIYFIDGQALTPSSFGETDSNGVWVPKTYSGTYGTNGFHLDFEDAALTAGSNTGLGKDVSGNGNYWTTNNISVTAGVTYDSMVDTPTNSYATLNPLAPTVGTLSNANLTGVYGSAAFTNIRSTVAIPTGSLIYAEATMNQTGSGSIDLGFGVISPTFGANLGVLNAGYYGWECGGAVLNFPISNGTRLTNIAGTTTSGDVMQIAANTSTGKVWIGLNDTWYDSSSGTTGNPSAGTNQTFTVDVSGYFFALSLYGASSGISVNFGQRPFTYTPPTGFLALCTANRPSTSVTTSGTFTGNAAADGPFVWIGGVPTVLTINGNAVTFGTHADKTAGGFKLRTASASYNASGSNTWTATATMNFGTTSLSPAPAQGNP